MPRSSARNRQSRLTFTPLPSSSPATKGYNQQIRDRAAAVIIDSSPSPAKRRKLRSSEARVATLPSDHRQEALMLTPNASSSRIEELEDEDMESEPIRPTQRRSKPGTGSRLRARPTQLEIDFSRSRDPSSFDTPIKLQSSSRSLSSRTGMFNASTQPHDVAISSDESESDDQLPTSANLLSKRASRMPRTVSSANGSSESEGITVKEHSLARHAEDKENDDEDEDMPITLGRGRRSKRAASETYISPSPPHDDESDDDVIIVQNPKRKRMEAKETSSDAETEQENIQPITPRSRRLKRGRRMTQREKDELDEDLEFLGPSSDAEKPSRTPRDTQTVQQNARRKALEALKKKRTKHKQSLSNDVREADETSNNGDRIDQDDLNELYDNNNDDDNNNNDDYDDDTDDYGDGDGHAQVMSSRQMFQEDADDADFLTDEGDEAPLGIPDGLPIEFTKYASMKPRALFKYAVEWMVQKKINPAYEGNDELYRLAFKKLDDEVRGLAGSKFTSSAWTPEFTLALEARPDIAYEPIDRASAEHFLRDRCDACNRGSHPATFQIQFQGDPYHRETLEEISNDDEEDSQSSMSDSCSASNKAAKDGQPEYDEQGREIAPASLIFYVGKFCMANAHTAHSLRHWRYHLNEWVITWLVKEGYCSPAKVVERDSWKTKKRRKYANKIVDRMEEGGTIKELWRSFRSSTDEARNSKQGRLGGMSP